MPEKYTTLSLPQARIEVEVKHMPKPSHLCFGRERERKTKQKKSTKRESSSKKGEGKGGAIWRGSTQPLRQVEWNVAQFNTLLDCGRQQENGKLVKYFCTASNRPSWFPESLPAKSTGPQPPQEEKANLFWDAFFLLREGNAFSEVEVMWCDWCALNDTQHTEKEIVLWCC